MEEAAEKKKQRVEKKKVAAEKKQKARDASGERKPMVSDSLRASLGKQGYKIIRRSPNR